MEIKVLKSKIHNAIVTDHNVDYDGSIGLDANLIKAANFSVYEKVHVLNIDNGQRLETYVIEEDSGSGNICVYGAAAHLIKTGQRVIILSYASISTNVVASHKPTVIRLDQHNNIQD